MSKEKARGLNPRRKQLCSYIDDLEIVVVIPDKFKPRFVVGDMFRMGLICLEIFSVEIESRDFVFCDVVEVCIFHFVFSF
jgi:hypothetical protein